MMSIFAIEDPAAEAHVAVIQMDGRPEWETECDEIARLASSVCRTPLSLVMLRDADGSWYKASGFLRVVETPIPAALCDRVLANEGVLTVNNPTQNELFSIPPRLDGEVQWRFLAGIAIRTQERETLGILCTVDVVPRVLASEQEQSLELLARQLQARIELRVQRTKLEALVQEKAKAGARLAASEELFRAFMNASPFLSYIKDEQGHLRFYNRAFAERFGVSDDAWLGHTDEQLWGRDPSTAIRHDDLEVIAGGKMVESEEQLRERESVATTWKTYKFPCRDSQGNALVAGVAVDITEEVSRKSELARYQRELEIANEQLRRLSVTDELTGLRNRRAFDERLSCEFSIARRRNRSLSVLLLDVDHFKQVNDRWGHAAGDSVLRRLGTALQSVVRLPDLVARYGGEEFAVLVAESSAEAALRLAQRLMVRIAQEPWAHETITVSIGLTTLGATVANGVDLVNQADEALYAAKNAGRNCIVVSGSQPSMMDRFQVPSRP